MVWPAFTKYQNLYLTIDHDISKTSVGYGPASAGFCWVLLGSTGFCWVLLGSVFLLGSKGLSVFRTDLRSRLVSYWRDTYSKLPSVKMEEASGPGGSSQGAQQ